jgi:uncharacterized membrane protein
MKNENIVLLSIFVFVATFCIFNPMKMPEVSTNQEGLAWVEAVWNPDYDWEIREGEMINDTFWTEKIIQDSISSDTFLVPIPPEYVKCFIAD